MVDFKRQLLLERLAGFQKLKLHKRVWCTVTPKTMAAEIEQGTTPVYLEERYLVVQVIFQRGMPDDVGIERCESLAETRGLLEHFLFQKGAADDRRDAEVYDLRYGRRLHYAQVKSIEFTEEVS